MLIKFPYLDLNGSFMKSFLQWLTYWCANDDGSQFPCMQRDKLSVILGYYGNMFHF